MSRTALSSSAAKIAAGDKASSTQPNRANRFIAVSGSGPASLFGPQRLFLDEEQPLGTHDDFRVFVFQGFLQVGDGQAAEVFEALFGLLAFRVTGIAQLGDKFRDVVAQPRI